MKSGVDDVLNIQNSFQINSASKPLILEKQEYCSQTSILAQKRHIELFDIELLQIPMRRGETVDYEKIIETNKVQSERIVNEQKIIAIQERKEEDLKDDNTIQISKSQSSSLDTNQKSELGKSKVEQLNMLLSKAISVNSNTQDKKCQKTSFKLLINVKDFYRMISKNSRIYQKLTAYQYKLIGDNSTIFLKQYSLKQYPKLIKLLKILQIINTRIQQLLVKIPIFSPYHVLKLIWDFFIALLILSVNFLLSLTIFFDMGTEDFKTFFQFSFCVFLFNMIIYLNTGVIVKGKFIQDRAQITKIYLKKDFLLSQIGMVPLYLQTFTFKIEERNVQIVNLLVLAKIYEFSNIVERITSVLNYQKNMKNIIDLVRLVFIIGCVCHVFSLFWHGLAMHEISIGRTDTWLNEKSLQNEKSILIKYIYSFYYLSTTMITVGYGDITPQNPIEVTLTILTMFVTGFFYAYSLNKIGKILQDIEIKDKSYKHSMQIIHAFMREENINSELRIKVSNYLKYFYKESNEIQKSEESVIINQLSHQLKDDLMLNVKGKYLKEIPFIQSLNSKNKLIDIMNEYLFSPGEYIFNQDESDDCSLFYLVKGEVEILIENENQSVEPMIIKSLQKQNYFGEISFITGNQRSASARASDFCRVYKLERSSFLELIKYDSYDYERFCMIKESIMLKQNYKLAKVQCYSCKSDSHIISECPKIHFTLSKNTVALRTFKSAPQIERQHCQRRRRYYNSLCLLDLCLHAAYKILSDEIFSNELIDSEEDDDEIEIASNLDYLINEFEIESQDFIPIQNSSIQKKSNFLNQNTSLQINNYHNTTEDEKLMLQSCYGQLSFIKNEDLSIVDNQYFDRDRNQSFSDSIDNNNNLKIEDKGSAFKNSTDNIIQNRKQDISCASIQQFESISIQKMQQSNEEKELIDYNKVQGKDRDSKQVKSQISTNPILKNQYSSQSPNKHKIKNALPKQVSFLQGDEENKSNQHSSDIFIQNSDQFHSQQQLQQNSQLQQQQFIQQQLQHFHEQQNKIIQIQSKSENDLYFQNDSERSCEINNYNQQAQEFFKKIKSKTINQQRLKVQRLKSNLSNNNQKRDMNNFQYEEQKRRIQNEGKNQNYFSDNLRMSLLDERNKKILYDELKKKVSHTYLNECPQKNCHLDIKVEEYHTNKKGFTLEKDFDTHLQQTIQKSSENSLQRHSISNDQPRFTEIEVQKQQNDKPQKYLDYNKQEWNYFQLKYFEKAYIYEYYYPDSNFNLAFRNFRKVSTKKLNLKNKMTLIANRLNGVRRSPIMGKILMPQ